MVVFVEFRLLGPVEVRAPEPLPDLGHARQRCVLVVLLLDAGRPVPVGTLIDRVWGQDPPGTALNIVYGYVARLRRGLAPAGVRIAHRCGGYLVDVDPETVDVHRFRRLVTAAAQAGDPARAAAGYDEALALWRGDPFAGVASPWLTRVAGILAGERLGAVLARDESYLRLRRHGAPDPGGG
jgi:DNA-binding SARP family transcriptional activator